MIIYCGTSKNKDIINELSFEKGVDITKNTDVIDCKRELHLFPNNIIYDKSVSDEYDIILINKVINKNPPFGFKDKFNKINKFNYSMLIKYYHFYLNLSDSEEYLKEDNNINIENILDEQMYLDYGVSTGTASVVLNDSEQDFLNYGFSVFKAEQQSLTFIDDDIYNNLLNEKDDIKYNTSVYSDFNSFYNKDRDFIGTIDPRYYTENYKKFMTGEDEKLKNNKLYNFTLRELMDKNTYIFNYDTPSIEYFGHFLDDDRGPSYIDDRMSFLCSKLNLLFMTHDISELEFIYDLDTNHCKFNKLVRSYEYSDVCNLILIGSLKEAILNDILTFSKSYFKIFNSINLYFIIKLNIDSITITFKDYSNKKVYGVRKSKGIQFSDSIEYYIDSLSKIQKYAENKIELNIGKNEINNPTDVGNLFI